MGNILSAIKSIVSASSLDVIEESNEIIHNRANQMGDAFEDYVKNAFANCLGQSVRDIKHARYQTFSYFNSSLKNGLSAKPLCAASQRFL